MVGFSSDSAVLVPQLGDNWKHEGRWVFPPSSTVLFNSLSGRYLETYGVGPVLIPQMEY